MSRQADQERLAEIISTGATERWIQVGTLRLSIASFLTMVEDGSRSGMNRAATVREFGTAGDHELLTALAGLVASVVRIGEPAWGSELAVTTSGTVTGVGKSAHFRPEALLAGSLVLLELQSRMYGCSAQEAAPVWYDPSDLVERLSTYEMPEVAAACVFPLQSISALTAVLRCILGNGSLLLLDPSHPPSVIVDEIGKRGCMTLAVPPAVAARLAMGGAPVDSLFHVGVGGGSIAPTVLHRLEERLEAVATVGYGLTEAGGVLTTSSIAASQHQRYHTVGSTAPWVEVRVLDAANLDGDIEFRSPAAAASSNAGPESGVEGWRLTGDVGHFEGDDLVVAGRRDDLILRGGAALSPVPIEEVLEESSEVDVAIVVGVRNPRTASDDVVAVVDGSEALDLKLLRRRCLDSLTPTQCPRRIIQRELSDRFVSALGKKRRRLLRQEIELEIST